MNRERPAKPLRMIESDLDHRRSESWMFDSAACVSMDVSKRVQVPVRQLRILQRLPTAVGEGGSSILVEHQHSSDFSVQGSADAHETQMPTSPTGSVPATNDTTNPTDWGGFIHQFSLQISRDTNRMRRSTRSSSHSASVSSSLKPGVSGEAIETQSVSEGGRGFQFRLAYASGYYSLALPAC